jgi:YbbR domain-containing protein
MVEEEESLTRSFRKRGALKLLALVLAFICWFMIREATSYEQMIRDVQMKITPAAGWAVLDQSVNTVNVLFRGSEGDLRYLNRDQISIDIDVREKSKQGTRTIKLSPDLVRCPAGMRAVLVDPAQITITLDTETDKVVPVKADIEGRPLEDFEIDKIVCTPSNVTVHGPRLRLDQIEVVHTEPIGLEGRVRSFRLERELHKPGENWSARFEPSRVRVDVGIVELSARKEIADVRVNALMPAGSTGLVRFEPAKVKVILQGRNALIGEMQRERIVAFVDCSQMKPGQTQDLPIRVPVSSGIDVASIEPPSVKVTMEAR